MRVNKRGNDIFPNQEAMRVNKEMIYYKIIFLLKLNKKGCGEEEEVQEWE